MAITLPGARGLFSHMQDALRHVGGERVALPRGIHQALADFLWLVETLIQRPIRLYELVPLQSTLDVYHDAYGYMCGRAVLLELIAMPQTPKQHPSAAATSPEPTGADFVSRAHFPRISHPSLSHGVTQKSG